MDDIYSNLENYDDVNAIDELKNENRTLKQKLEESSKAMNLLQKDFDKLNSEYKKLEINYSSLLKTARAEIERKTQLITNLNKEKDMIVIKAMQSGRNVLKKPFHNYKKNERERNEIKNEENKDAVNKITPGISKTSSQCSRKSPMLQMKDSTTSTTTRSTLSEQNLPLDDDCSKENMLKSVPYQTNNDKPKTAKISNRRKSMPVLSNSEEQNISEEDEVKDKYRNTRDPNKHQEYDQFRQNSQYLGSNRVYETNRSEKFNNDSKQTHNRGVERYNPYFDRHTPYNQNNYSPERGRQRQHRSDYSRRSDYQRQRVLESPPKDKYKSSRSRERRHVEREYKRDFDYQNSRYEDNYNTRSNIREPDLKRRRMDSSSTDRDRHDQGSERRSFRFSEYRPEVASENLMSCQSPDYDQIESNLSHHYVKEIKNTATVQLEDPRKSSKKYLLKKSDRGTFITTVDKNIFLVPIDKQRWGFEKVEVPEALKANNWEEPANEDIVNCIYMDINDPDNISSLKSCKDSIDCTISRSETVSDTDGQDMYCKERSTLDKIKQKPLKTNVAVTENNYKIPKKSMVDVKSVQENVTKNNCNVINKEQLLNNEKQSSSKRKDEIYEGIYELEIQKLSTDKHNIEGDFELSDEASDITDEFQITCKENDKLMHVSDKDKDRDIGFDETCKKNCHKNYGEQKNHHIKLDNNDKKISNEKIHNNEKEETIQINVNSEKASKDVLSRKIKTCKKKTFKKKHDGKSLDNRDIITTEEKNESSKIEKKTQIDVDSGMVSKDNYSLENIETCERIISKNKCDGNSTENEEIKNEEKNESLKIDPKEARKGEKRKRLLSKETQKSKNESRMSHIDTGHNVQENKPKNSSKFTELFGESSSLITPEDLNIPTKLDVSMERNDNYGTLYENTQDAIDLNVREIKTVTGSDHTSLKLIENVKDILINENPQNVMIDTKNLFEIKDDQNMNAFKNLKPASIDDKSNIVKTVIISSGTQPCIEKENTNQITEVDNKETEKINKHHRLESLKAVATSTPNKMQHGDHSKASETDSPKSPNHDSNLSYTANVMTATNVEVNSDAPDVRIFIKRRRKIKKT